MKKLLFILALLPLGLQAQDTAEAVVGRYLRLLNSEALPADSMLVVETTISFHGLTDTMKMRRYYAPKGMLRVEVSKGDTLLTGLCTNGTDRWREFARFTGWWGDITPADFESKMQPYDPRGPLYDWKRHGITLRYNGVTTYEGQRLQVVRAEQMDHYTRLYMFEEASGLLVVALDRNELPEGSFVPIISVKPVDYKIIHEYTPLGMMLLPTQESFLRDGLLTILESTAHLEARQNRLFNQD